MASTVLLTVLIAAVTLLAIVTRSPSLAAIGLPSYRGIVGANRPAQASRAKSKTTDSTTPIF